VDQRFVHSKVYKVYKFVLCHGQIIQIKLCLAGEGDYMCHAKPTYLLRNFFQIIS
jgi:hypothetical protein